MIKRFIIILFPLFIGIPQVSGQNSIVGLFGGGSYYIGELNPYRHFDDQTQLAFGGVYRHVLNPRYNLRAHVMYGKVEGTDADASTQWRRNRNLHFRSNIVEVGGVLEMNFFEYAIGDDEHPYSPYIYGGFAYFHMNPQAKYKGKWRELQPLGTEGQHVPSNGVDAYHLDQISLPFGIGFKANVTGRMAVNVEWGMRRTWTDHLDDVGGTYPDTEELAARNSPVSANLSDRRLDKDLSVSELEGSQRGNPNNDDWYVFSGVMVTFLLGKEETVCNTFNSGM